MTQTSSPLIARLAFLVLVTAFVVSLGYIAEWQPVVREPTIQMKVLDHPRCFPEGTLGVENFAGCIDSKMGKILGA